MFLYKPSKSKFDFELYDDLKEESNNQKMKNVSINIDINLQYIKQLFNADINNDIVLREINIFAGKNKYKAVLCSVDGLVNKQIINENILGN